MAKRRGAERQVYYGAAGSTASTQLTVGVTDVGLNNPNEFNEHTDRGDGSAFPKKTEQLVCLAVEPTFTFLYYNGNATQAAVIAAARTGTVLAIKIVRYSGGETEFDGDCYIEMSSPGGLKDGMPVEITCHPTDDSGRAWTVG